MGENDANAETIGDYFRALLGILWFDRKGFSGKRPFGNSEWNYELYTALVKAGFIEGRFDDEGYLNSCDFQRGYELISEALKNFGKTGD